jgi:hypothetical protein
MSHMVFHRRLERLDLRPGEEGVLIMYAIAQW